MTEDDRKRFDEAIGDLAEFWQAVHVFTGYTGLGLPYAFKHMAETAKALIDMCPLQPGNVAELIDPPAIDQKTSWGWLGAKHLFTVGRRVEICHVTWRADERCHVVGFKFEVETYIHYSTQQECPVSERCLYSLGAARFRKVSP